MSGKTTIANAGNVVVPAYLTLLERGYTVKRTLIEDDTQEQWSAGQDQLHLVAEDPVTLLGLAAMFESRGPNWTASDLQIESFLKEFGAE